jgi:hypothetical protein
MMMMAAAAMASVHRALAQIAATPDRESGDQLSRFFRLAFRALAGIWIARRGDLLELLGAPVTEILEESHALPIVASRPLFVANVAKVVF